MKPFYIYISDNIIWNRLELEKFLVDNQQKSICVIVEGSDCKQCGIYDLLDLFEFESVTVCTNNALEKHNRYKVKLIQQWLRYFDSPEDPEKYQQYHAWNQHKVFSIFYNRPYWHRIGLAAYMYTHHLDKTLINFRSNPNNIDDRDLYELNSLFVNHPESARLFLNLYTTFPLMLGTVDNYDYISKTVAHTDQLCEHYPNALIDIVSETFVIGNSFFVTEKTVRPMLLKKPMITMAARDQLMYLRRMGFKTFNDFWDEEYDGYEGTDRYKKILELLDSLAKKSIIELNSMYLDMQHILDHNYKLLIERKFITDTQTIINQD